MNKKFSTLVATLLLSGALVSVEATAVTPDQIQSGVEVTSGKILFTENVDLGNEWLEITEDNVVIDGQGFTLNGRLVIKGNGCTVKNLNIILANKAGNNTEQKTAITVAAKSVTITNNVITCSAEGGYLANAISVFPTDADANIVIENNKIIGANPIVAQWQSAGITVVQNLEKSTLYTGKSATLSDKAVVSIDNNVFEDCGGDYIVSIYDDSGASDYEVIRVSPLYNDKGEIQNQSYVRSLVNNTTVDAKVIFNGSAAELIEIAGDQTGENAAVECNDGNVLYGNATNPDNGKSAVLAAVKPALATVQGYELEENATSDYSMLILTNQDNDAYVITIENGKAKAIEVSTIDLGNYANSSASLWKMTSGKESDGRIYYKFENQDKVQLKAAIVTDGLNDEALAVAEAANKGTFYAENNIPYNKGVALAVNGLDLQVNTPAVMFGLYKAGNQVLSVEDLMWYENDGFSVTIKYEDEKGEFKKEDIAGNPFQKHLTPMRWTGSEFVEFTTATDNAEDFYLKDAEGNYIVAQKYASSGSTQNQSTYVFTTVTEKVLEHDLVKAEGNYYGSFKAEVSAKYTDLKTLTAIDVLKVELPAGWAEIGRLDLGTAETPTLAASVSTDLKPILIALGSNKVVNPKTFLQKGKFYTVTKLDKEGQGKYLAAAGDKYEGYEGDWFVESYGNDLEIQFALTYENGYFVFSNRETPSYRWSYLQANQLYYGEGENEYVYGSTTYVIAPVKEHKATDGYDNETLVDVKNNKFHIGFVSGVFDNNAWFTENHEGTTNHTIGLDVDVENALTFTATKYDAVRKIEHNAANHTDTYYPTDSIYVISELGYYEGNDYKTTKDTLKIVSYSFVNQWNEPLVYGEAYSSSARYVSLPINPETGKRFASVAEAAPFAQKFALRIDNNELNLRPVDNYSWKKSGNSESYLTHQDFNKYSKVYAGDAANGILDEQHLYDRTENDLFVVEPTEKPMYRRVVSPLDTISIYRNDNSQSVLFESGKFLGMENLSQFPNLAPGMIADTAYIGNGDETYYRPQYMLVVDADVTPASEVLCEICGQKDCEHSKISGSVVEGRFLVNLKDTAIAWATANKHKDGNPYINSENYYKLGFVQATHRNDSLIVASDPENRIFVGDENFNVAKFAFRYVDSEEGSFVIETADYVQLPDEKAGELKDTYGYLKWMNGVVVVVDDIKNADVYNMNEAFEGDPTANENITAGNVVVAGVNGAVVVKGAEGKNVIVSTILGKVVANEVVSSDNATIAAPAGVVVVSVDGESFKVVVK